MNKRRDKRVNLILDIKKNRIKSDSIQATLKYDLDAYNRDYVLSKLSKKHRDLVYNNPLPEFDHDICRNTAILETERNILRELTWNLDLIINYSSEINKYLLLRDKIETAIFNNSFENFYELIIQLETTVCHSLYGITTEMLVNELNSNPEENNCILEEITDVEAESKLVISVEIARCRVNQKLPSWQYDSLIDQHRKAYPPNLSEFIDYVDFKFDPTWENNGKKLNNLAFIICFDSDFSIIDRYNSIKNILPVLLSQNSLTPEEINIIIEKSEMLGNLIHDPFWDKLALIDKPAKTIKPSNRASTYYKIQDLFFLDNHSLVIDKCTEILKTYPYYSEIYLFYIKSLILENKQISEYLKHDTELTKLLELIKSILEKGKNYIVDRDKLLNKYYTISHLSFSYALKEFIFNEYNMDIPKNVSYSSLLNIDPIRYNFVFHVMENTEVFLENPAIKEYEVYKQIGEFKKGQYAQKNNSLFFSQLKIGYLIANGKYTDALIELEDLKLNFIDKRTDLTFRGIHLNTYLVRVN